MLLYLVGDCGPSLCCYCGKELFHTRFPWPGDDEQGCPRAKGIASFSNEIYSKNFVLQGTVKNSNNLIHNMIMR